MKRFTYRAGPALTALLGLVLLAPGAARAANLSYTIQKIARLGELAGDTLLPSGGPYQFVVGPLNDSGQLLFGVGDLAAVIRKPNLLLQYADGKITPIAAPERDGPLGKWPKNFGVYWLASMNQSGDVVFAAGHIPIPPGPLLGTFLWDAKARQFAALARPGMPATGDLIFTGANGFSPAINNPGDIALIQSVRGPTAPGGFGLFFLGRDQKLQPVLLPGQELPGGGKAVFPDVPSITDSGAVAFLAFGRQGGYFGAYRWEQGTLTPLLLAGTDVPGVGKIVAVSGAFLNNKNRTALVSARVSGSSGHGLYRVAEVQLLPVAVPGQQMPGGGKLQSAVASVPGLGPVANTSVSPASEAGEHAFWATLEDGATAAYRVGVEGNLSLILKSGTPTELGTITKIGQSLAGSGIGLNSQGQVALAVQIDNGPDTLVLLTPTAP